VGARRAGATGAAKLSGRRGAYEAGLGRVRARERAIQKIQHGCKAAPCEPAGDAMARAPDGGEIVETREEERGGETVRVWNAVRASRAREALWGLLAQAEAVGAGAGHARQGRRQIGAGAAAGRRGSAIAIRCSSRRSMAVSTARPWRAVRRKVASPQRAAGPRTKRARRT